METMSRGIMTNYLMRYDLLSEFQHGFLVRRSTELQLLLALNEAVDNQLIDLAYLDFQKAFDSVVHEKLITKLNQLGIKGNLQRWINSHLSGRTQRVRINDTLSASLPVTSSVLKEPVLAPFYLL